jgi:hypothetical protein
LHILETNGQTNKFFSLWFSSIDIFTRVHDKKLSIAAITSLIVLPADQVPVSVQPGWPRLLQGIVRLFQTLPAAIKNREEATREDDFGLGGDYDDDEEEEEWEGEVDWAAEEVEGEADDVKDESAAYLDFLSQQASKFSSIGDDDDDDELEEESLLETPLDKVEPYGMFKHALFRKFNLTYTPLNDRSLTFHSSSTTTTPALPRSDQNAESRGATNHPDGRKSSRPDCCPTSTAGH